MLNKGDYVNYAAQGICQIEDIRTMKFSPQSGRQMYYQLRPLEQDHTQVYVPVENEKLVERMRAILSPTEIDQTILSVKHQAMPWISERKQRSAQFQEILARRDERELLLLVSCLYLKSKETSKGLSDTDAQVLRRAEGIIQREFAFSLGITPQNVGRYIREKLEMEEPSVAQS